MKYLTILPILLSVVFLSCEKEYLKVTGLTEAEEADLIFMVEEEKLAMDVYNLAFDTYGEQVFSHIAAAESRHQTILMEQMTYNDVEAPAFPEEAGQFNNADLQALYAELSRQVLISLPEALRVGVLIEETDITDLTQVINEADDARLIRVYKNLREASHRHLRAFRLQLNMYEN